KGRLGRLGRLGEGDVDTDIEARKLGRSNALHSPLERSGLPHRAVVTCLGSGQFNRKKQASIGTKFVDALAEPLAIGVQENVATSRVQRKRHTADFGMVEWLAAANPQHRRFALSRSSNGNRRRL